jgi:ribonuclease H / adenosylcobalamin/alpha-ribazole phosphatase
MDRAAGKPIAAAIRPRPTTASWTPPTTARTRLLLVRHGSTAHSAEQRFSGRNDLPLNEVGEWQAAALGAREFGPVAAVISSPLRRAVQTAEAIAGPRRLPVEIVDGFAETDFGVWEGLTFAEAAERDPDVLRTWRRSPDAAPPGGESFAVVGARVEAARAAVVDAHPESTVVVVTHVTPIKWLVCAALEAPPIALFRLHLDTASVSTVDHYPDGNLSVTLVNDTSHLA